MKIDLREVWNFIELLDADERGWEFSLEAGMYQVGGIKPKTLLLLQKDEGYDTELLPSLFTFREVLWQPDVFTEGQMSISPLRVLKSFCDESMQILDRSNEVQLIYFILLEGMASCCVKAEALITEGKQKATDVLGHFRTCTFPIIKFFIHHPMNRPDYYQDAMNRLNYAVKIMLTQYYGLYTELTEPHWILSKSKATNPLKTDDKK